MALTQDAVEYRSTGTAPADPQRTNR
jgi:hypothetical protein